MNETKKEIVYHVEWLSVLFSVIAGLFIMINRMDDMNKQMHDLSVQQSQRSDKLYEMFIDLLKERK